MPGDDIPGIPPGMDIPADPGIIPGPGILMRRPERMAVP